MSETAKLWTTSAEAWSTDADDRSRATTEALRREYAGFVDLAARGVQPSARDASRLGEVLRDLQKTGADFKADVDAHKPARPVRYLALAPGKEPEDPGLLRNGAKYINLLMSQFGNETPWADREIECEKFGALDARFSIERHPKQSPETFDVYCRCLGVAGRPKPDLWTCDRKADPLATIAGRNSTSAAEIRKIFMANGLADRRDLVPLVLCCHTLRDVLIKCEILRQRGTISPEATLDMFGVPVSYLQQIYNPRGINYEPEIHDDREREIRQRQIRIADQVWPLSGGPVINPRAAEIDAELAEVERRKANLLAERAGQVVA